MLRINCLLLLVLFTAFTARNIFAAEKKVLSSVSCPADPLTDGNPIGETDSDDSSPDPEDEDYQIVEKTLLNERAVVIHQHLQPPSFYFKNLSREVTAPPPEV